MKAGQAEQKLLAAVPSQLRRVDALEQALSKMVQTAYRTAEQLSPTTPLPEKQRKQIKIRCKTDKKSKSRTLRGQIPMTGVAEAKRLEEEFRQLLQEHALAPPVATLTCKQHGRSKGAKVEIVIELHDVLWAACDQGPSPAAATDQGEDGSKDPSLEEKKSWEHSGQALVRIVRPSVATEVSEKFQAFVKYLAAKGALPMLSERNYTGYWDDEATLLSELVKEIVAFPDSTESKAVADWCAAENKRLQKQLQQERKQLKSSKPKQKKKAKHKKPAASSSARSQQLEANIAALRAEMKALTVTREEKQQALLEQRLNHVFRDNRAWVKFVLEVRAKTPSYFKKGANWDNWTCRQLHKHGVAKCSGSTRCDFHRQPLWVQIAALFVTFANSLTANTFYWDVRYLLMAGESKLFDSKVNKAAKYLRSNIANSIMHVDLKLDHKDAYRAMRALLEAVGDTKRVAELEAHRKANDAFWPACTALEKLEQGKKRADYLTDQQFKIFFEFVLAKDSSRRYIIDGPPSCGKTFILVHSAVHYALQDSRVISRPSGPPRRTLLLSHSQRLQQATTRLSHLTASSLS